MFNTTWSVCPSGHTHKHTKKKQKTAEFVSFLYILIMITPWSHFAKEWARMVFSSILKLRSYSIIRATKIHVPCPIWSHLWDVAFAPNCGWNARHMCNDKSLGNQMNSLQTSVEYSEVSDFGAEVSSGHRVQTPCHRMKMTKNNN